MGYWVDSTKHPDKDTGIYSVIDSSKTPIWEGVGLDGRDTAYEIAIVLDYYIDPDGLYKRLDSISKTKGAFYDAGQIIKDANSLKGRMKRQSFPAIVNEAVEGILEKIGANNGT